jgi:hypothetical protein
MATNSFVIFVIEDPVRKSALEKFKHQSAKLSGKHKISTFTSAAKEEDAHLDALSMSANGNKEFYTIFLARENLTLQNMSIIIEEDLPKDFGFFHYQGVAQHKQLVSTISVLPFPRVNVEDPIQYTITRDAAKLVLAIYNSVNSSERNLHLAFIHAQSRLKSYAFPEIKNTFVDLAQLIMNEGKLELAIDPDIKLPEVNLITELNDKTISLLPLVIRNFETQRYVPELIKLFIFDETSNNELQKIMESTFSDKRIRVIKRKSNNSEEILTSKFICVLSASAIYNSFSTLLRVLTLKQYPEKKFSGSTIMTILKENAGNPVCYDYAEFGNISPRIFDAEKLCSDTLCFEFSGEIETIPKEIITIGELSVSIPHTLCCAGTSNFHELTENNSLKYNSLDVFFSAFEDDSDKWEMIKNLLLPLNLIQA